MTYKPSYTIPDILQMRSEGKTYSEIGHHFRISRSRVGHIIQHERQRAKLAQRSAAIHARMRAVNDLDRKWPVEDLFCVLDLPPRADTVLRSHFEKQGVTECSLRDLMDLLIPFVEGSGDYYDHLPAYRIKYLGQIFYGQMIKGLSAVDGGDEFATEWEDRKEGLRKYLTSLRGGFPYLLHGRNPALGKGTPTNRPGGASCGLVSAESADA